jgi:tRNA(Ile)-lysidine synthetase-like protein
MQGEPVRGGGRSAGTHTQAAFALSLEALARYPLALQRRIVRAAVKPCCVLSLSATKRILDLARQSGASNKWIEVEGGIQVRRLHRELQFQQVADEPASPPQMVAEAEFTGDPVAIGGLRLICAPARTSAFAETLDLTLPVRLRVRPWHAGDRYFAPHTREPKKLKEHLQRLKLSSEQRATWPVLEVETAGGPEIVWVRALPARAVRLLRTDSGSEYVGNLCVEETEA